MITAARPDCIASERWGVVPGTRPGPVRRDGQREIRGRRAAPPAGAPLAGAPPPVQAGAAARAAHARPEVPAHQEKNLRRGFLEYDHFLAARAQRESGRLVPPLFHHPRGTKLDNIDTAWKRPCREAGVPGRFFRDSCRTAVRTPERAGVARSVAMKRTGHKSDAVFRRHDSVCEAGLAAGVAKLSQLELPGVPDPLQSEQLEAAEGTSGTVRGQFRLGGEGTGEAETANPLENNGAGRGTRTPTTLRSADFKSAASARFAIPAHHTIALRSACPTQARRAGRPS